MKSDFSDKFKQHLPVGIVGCGWLGKSLANSLLSKGVSVLATSSKQVNVDKLNLQEIKAQQLMLPVAKRQLSQHDIFAQSYLVIAITPQFKQGRTDYADKVADIVKAAQQRGKVQRIILLSSTAVYHGLTDKVNEDSLLDFETEKVRILYAAEQAVLKFYKQVGVIRLAGLVGPERHPGKFMLANKTLSNATAPVNLVHQQDAVGIIEALLQANAPQGIFNCVSDTHVSKQQYYQVAAQALKVEPPIFSQNDSNEMTRIVSGEKAKQVLNYKFIYPDLLTWL